MEELLKETEELLKNYISNTNYRQYQLMYKKIYGTDWHGCSCKKDKLMNEIINWYNQNKL